MVRRLLVGDYDRFLNCKRLLLLYRIIIWLLFLLFRRILNLCLHYFLMDSRRERFIILLLDITHGRPTFSIHRLVVCVDCWGTRADTMGRVPHQIGCSCCAIHAQHLIQLGIVQVALQRVSKFELELSLKL